MRNRAYSNKQWDAFSPSGPSRPQHRRQGSYISPYHESPVDLDKYDTELNTTETNNKSSSKHGDAGCWPSDYGQCEINMVKSKAKNGKTPSRPLATGCAANYEVFGGKSPRTAELLEDQSEFLSSLL